MRKKRNAETKRMKYEHVNVKVAAPEIDFLEEEEICGFCRSFNYFLLLIMNVITNFSPL